MLLIALILTCNKQWSEAQKPILDSTIFGKWPFLDDPKISCDGRYAMYLTINQPSESRTLTIQATNSAWKKEFSGIISDEFSSDGSWAIFMDTNYSLVFQSLRNDTKFSYSNVASYKLTRKGGLVAIQRNDSQRSLILVNLTTGMERNYSNVLNYAIGEKGDILILATAVSGNSQTLTEIDAIKLKENNRTVLWKGNDINALILDGEDNQIAFIERRENIYKNQLWNCNISESYCSLLTDDSLQGTDFGFHLGRIIKYSNDGKNIFFSLIKQDIRKLKGKMTDVEVWNYHDFKLQPQQLADLNPTNILRPQPTFTTSVRIRDKIIIRLEGENDRIISPLSSKFFSDDYVLMVHNRGDADNEWNWNPEAQSSIILASTIKSDRKVLDSGLAEPIFSTFRLSPSGKYVIYYNPIEKNYFSYSISTGSAINLTQNLGGRWTTFERNDEPDSAYLPFRLGGWSKNDSYAFIYDQNDIYMVDPSGKRSPKNITNGYGRSHTLIFRLAGDYFDKFVPENKKLIISAFDRSNKNDGFYVLNQGQSKDPEILTMEPYIFTGPDESLDVVTNSPIKAENNESYIVRRMSATESPNYFYTQDFKGFKPLSRLNPENKYNWLTSELIKFPTQNGDSSMGILYKPENFSPDKKYPIIFSYYERVSDALHNYIYPDACHGPINVPFFVSKGYLIFMPDIHYRVGFPGKSALLAVTYGATYLSQFNWVDSSKMGIHGHSFGGFETNYIITQTNIFHAAMSSSGMSDFISSYGSIIGKGTSRQGQYEIHRDRIGSTLWERPELYVENSPVLKADRITTPLLMMSNRSDSDVPFPQGVEFYTALRRLGKKVWMLQYSGADHLVFNNAASDLTQRICQFFDYFLKGMPPPKWMTMGISAYMKGYDDGLELDVSGRQP